MLIRNIFEKYENYSLYYLLLKVFYYNKIKNKFFYIYNYNLNLLFIYLHFFYIFQKKNFVFL